MSLAHQVDQLITLRNEVRAITKELDAAKARYKDAEQTVLSSLVADDATAIRGRVGHAFITEQDVLNVTDWDAFWSYVRDNDAHHLLHRRIAVRAALAQSEDEPIPGTEATTIRKLGLNEV